MVLVKPQVYQLSTVMGDKSQTALGLLLLLSDKYNNNNNNNSSSSSSSTNNLSI